MFAIQMIPHSFMRIEASVILAILARAMAIPEMSTAIGNPDRMGVYYGFETMNTSQVIYHFSERVKVTILT